MPSRGVAARLAATSTTESPWRTMTEPAACLASLPVSRRSALPLMEISRVVINRKSEPLLADVEAFDQVRVTLRVLAFQVVEEPAAASHEHQQAAAGVMIFGVCLEMFGQVVDAFAQECDLNFWRAGVAVVGLVRADDFSLAVFA